MSLKHFHIFFIMISVVMAAGFGFWCFLTDAGSAVAGSTVMGAVSLVAAVGLVIYGIKFLKMLEKEGIE